MSKTIRRKNEMTNFGKLFMFSERDLDENGLIEYHWDKAYVGLTLEEANIKRKQWFHSCNGPRFDYCPGKAYRQEYRAKSKQQLREQLNTLDDYEAVAIDKLCNDWRFWM
jgi:hypothetical protein